jgi:hypothetical protein
MQSNNALKRTIKWNKEQKVILEPLKVYRSSIDLYNEIRKHVETEDEFITKEDFL